MEKRTVWTLAYFPFTMGGEVYQPILTEVDVIEEREIGYGFKAFSFQTPKGKTRIAENVTGAIVGYSFEDVINDMGSTNAEEAQKQIDQAALRLKKGDTHQMTNEEFFKIYKY